MHYNNLIINFKYFLMKKCMSCTFLKGNLCFIRKNMCHHEAF